MKLSPAVAVAARVHVFTLTLVLGLATHDAVTPRANAATGGPTGRVQGRIVAIDTGEPIGFADVLLIPADTTMRRVGGQSNADGTFSLQAAPGRYALQFRALSYARKLIEGIVVTEGQVTPFSTGLVSEAIQQQEVVVEAQARRNTESSLLAARRKAPAVGDAVSAEQVRRSPDKDAAEVLRRVTGLSVSDGKYVFVRGLGERYSSTEVDGVRIASPEENKRVVPLDLLPSALIDNVVVQKTYTADRSGEFGGGDVQVRTRDFPGKRIWSFSSSVTNAEHVSFKHRQSYAGAKTNFFGFSADGRGIPSVLSSLFPGRKIPLGGSKPSAANVAAARAFRNVWSANSAYTAPNSSYSLTVGDEVKLFGRPLGFVSSWSNSRSYDDERRSHKTYEDYADTLVNYPTRISTASADLGGTAKLSYRVSPRHAVKVHGFFSSSADDEVVTYEGTDYQRDEAMTGLPLEHKVTRLKYVERSIASGSIEGEHEFKRLKGVHIDWKLGRSNATRVQPDMREVVYDKRYDDPAGPWHWSRGGDAVREFGDLSDDGWGSTITASAPISFGPLGNGKLTLGHDRQTKKRDNAYRRFAMRSTMYGLYYEDPEVIYAPENFDTLPGGNSILENTFDRADLSDNYTARLDVFSSFASLDVPFGKRLRANFGLRYEEGDQEVRAYPLFRKDLTLQRGHFAKFDLLPTANLTWLGGSNLNVRLAGSRTLSRPDLNELSPSPRANYVNDFMVVGNPNLRRFLIDNYDVRVELFPSLSEVLAVGAFYKRLHNPIEQTIQAGVLRALKPYNTGAGWDRGIEAEVRARLGRVWRPLARFSLNSNASFIASRVDVGKLSTQGTLEHPLQGQANYLVNTALSWTAESGRTDVSVLTTATGKRLKLLGFKPLPDVYEMPTTTLDATINWAPSPLTRVKFAAKNLLDRTILTRQGYRESEAYRSGRSYTIALAVGS